MPPHKGQTDKTTTITLPSAIEQVLWMQWIAAPGGRVGLEVFTKYVGSNAELEVTLTDKDGKKHGTLKDKIHNNHYETQVSVPVDARTALFATVKLAKHGLEKKSGALLLTAPFTFTNARWDRPIACRGDVLPITADVKDLPDGSEVTVSVWAYDPDGSHERLTFFPGLVVSGKVQAEWAFDYHGDLVADTAGRDGQALEFFYRVEKDGITVDSDLIKFIWVIVELVGEDDKPVPSQRYEVRLPDGTKRQGRLDLEGRALIDSIPQEGECKFSFLDLDQDAWEKL